MKKQDNLPEGKIESMNTENDDIRREIIEKIDSQLLDPHYFRTMSEKFDSLAGNILNFQHQLPNRPMTPECLMYLNNTQKNILLVSSLTRCSIEHCQLIFLNKKDWEATPDKEKLSKDLLSFEVKKIRKGGQYFDSQLLEELSFQPYERNQFILHKFYELFYVSSFSYFEFYLYDICKKLLSIDPRLVESTKVDLLTIKKLEEKNQLTEFFIEKTLKIISTNANSYRKFLKKALHIDFETQCTTHLSTWELFRNKRNCIIHGRGLITQENFSKIGYSKNDVGGKISICDRDILTAPVKMVELVGIIDHHVTKKYGEKALM